MKRVLYLLPVLCLLMSACQKEQDKKPEIVVCLGTPLWTGPWQLYAYWYSPGAGPVSWTPATEKATIQFEPDFLFSSTKGNQDRYLVASRGTETLLKLYKQGNTDTSVFIINIDRDTLYLHNIGCIEGCAEKYIRPTQNSVVK
jgi:hypothetical protein